MAFSLEKLNWSQIKKEVKEADKNLYEVIEELNPEQNQPLIKARYRFGDTIIDTGITYLPTEEGRLVPLTDPTVPTEIQKLLDYAPIPLFLILKNSCEVYVDIHNRIIPLNFCFAGKMLGLFEALDFITENPSNPLWSVSAGARSIFMLPRIAEMQGIKNLIKYYKLPATMPCKDFTDQWAVFKHISQQENFGENWYCEVLFFPIMWLEKKLKKQPSTFQQYITSACWKQIQYTLGQVDSSIIWQFFHEAIINRNLFPRPYISDTVKHLLRIINNKYPTFIPADDSDQVAPIKKLQEIFINIYGIKEYYPTFMYPYHFSSTDTPVYYSLSNPLLLDGRPESNKRIKLMQDLREIKLLIDTFWQRSDWARSNKNLKSIKFDFYHTESDAYGEIKTTEHIPEEDKRFILNHPTHKKFCMFSHFWRGCIRVSSHTT